MPIDTTARRLPLIDSLAAAERSVILQSAGEARLPAGHCLARGDRRTPELLIVVDGDVEYQVGGESRALPHLSFVWPPALSMGASVIAATKVTAVVIDEVGVETLLGSSMGTAFAALVARCLHAGGDSPTTI